MGILQASYLKQNIGGNFPQNKRKLASIVVVCRPCSCKWRILANIGDFEGLALGVYLSVIFPPIFCFKYDARNIPVQILQISKRLSGPLRRRLRWKGVANRVAVSCCFSGIHAVLGLKFCVNYVHVNREHE